MALSAKILQRLPCFRFRQGLAGAEHPAASLLLQGRGGAPGTKDDFVTLDGQVQGIARREVELVPEGFGTTMRPAESSMSWLRMLPLYNGKYHL